MGIKFWNYNLVDQASTVITATNVNSLYPVANLKDHRRTKAFRSTTASTVITFDFVTTEAVDSIIIAAHSKNGWGFTAPVTVEANGTNTWGSPAFTTTIASGDIDQKHEIAVKEFASQSYRFWRLSFSGTTYVELAKIFIGALQEVGASRTMSYDWQYLEDDLSIISVNRYGQRYVDEIDTQTRMIFDINLMTKSEFDDYLTVYDYNRKIRPFFFKVDSTNTIINNDNRLAGYFYFDSPPVISNPSHALWNTSVTMVEAL
jgi:hypothetical protein